MTTHPDNDAEDEGREPEELLGEIDQFDEHIQEGLQGDPRLDSGVPDSLRGSDLDFIRMSGLTAPTPLSDRPERHEDTSAPDLDASRPLSFFEKGVADVDSDLMPGLTEDKSGEHDIVPDLDSRAAMAHLRDMIAELTKDTSVTPPPPREPVDKAPPEAEPEAAPVLAEEALEAAPPAEAEPGRREALQDASQAPAEPAPEVAFLGETGELEPAREERTATAGAEWAAVTADEGDAGVHRDFVVEATAPPETPEPVETPRDTLGRPEPARDLRAGAERLGAKREETLARGPVPGSRGPEPEPPAAAPVLPSMEEAEEAMYLRHAHGKSRRRSGHRKHARRRVIRVLAALAALVVLGAGVYATWQWLDRAVANPINLYNDAAILAAKGEYLRASSMFSTFAERNPDHPLHADAQFGAAFALQEYHPTSKDELTRVYQRALGLFRQFIDDNPAHPKAARARTLMGRLEYELGQYGNAIDLLRDPELRLKDPTAAVPALRILARSYAKLGQDETARSYYLQSVGIQDNHTPDVDYMELASLYRNLAERADTPEARGAFEEQAIAEWLHASQVPGIDPATKKELRAKVDVMRERTGQVGPASDAETSGGEAGSDPDSTGVPWEATAPAVEDEAAGAPSNAVQPDADPPAEGSPGSAPAGSAPLAAPDANAAEVVAPEFLPEDTADETAYEVVSGDTLSSIASSHGVSVPDLMEWNNLTDSTIFAGQTLVIHNGST